MVLDEGPDWNGFPKVTRSARAVANTLAKLSVNAACGSPLAQSAKTLHGASRRFTRDKPSVE